MSVTEYVKPELLILVPVLYLIGIALKKFNKLDKYIPIILGACGILISMLYVNNFSMQGLFSSITQGILCAGASVYSNQIWKQIKK